MIKRFLDLRIGLNDYKRHAEKVEASFAQFLFEAGDLPLNVSGNILLGYPEPGELPKKPVNNVSVYSSDLKNITDFEKETSKSFIDRMIVNRFKNNLRLSQHVIDSIVLLPAKRVYILTGSSATSLVHALNANKEKYLMSNVEIKVAFHDGNANIVIKTDLEKDRLGEIINIFLFRHGRSKFNASELTER